MPVYALGSPFYGPSKKRVVGISKPFEKFSLNESVVILKADGWSTSQMHKKVNRALKQLL